MNIQPLEGVGAEITGVDLSAPLPDAEFAAIRQAFADHGVVFFRDQQIDETQHIDFARRWSTINVNRFFAAHPDHPEIALVAKEPDQTQNIGGGWHTDHSYDVEPALGSILVARILPETGGDTLFACMYKAYEALDEATRAEIEGLNAVHSAAHIFGKDALYAQTGIQGEGRVGNANAADTLQSVTHPVVITHPLSGRRALYVNPAFTLHFEGMTREESQPLLTKLYTAAIDSGNVHRFQWRPGSIAFWDNRATWHWAKNDYHGHRRVMHRITLDGCALN